VGAGEKRLPSNQRRATATRLIGAAPARRVPRRSCRAHAATTVAVNATSDAPSAT
jgi:hypothetical protein